MKYLQLGKQLHKGNTFSKFYNFLCVNILPGIMFMHTLRARRPWPTEARRGQRSLKAGIAYGCELHVGAGNQTQIFCKNIILVLSHLSGPDEEQLYNGQKGYFSCSRGGFIPTLLYAS